MKINATWSPTEAEDGQVVVLTFTSDDGATWTAALTLSEAMSLYSELRMLGVYVGGESLGVQVNLDGSVDMVPEGS